MKTLKQHLHEAIYGDGDAPRLGVDPDRIPVESGVEYVVEAVADWLQQPEMISLLYDAYVNTMQVEGKMATGPMHSIQRRLIKLAHTDDEEALG